MQRLRRLDSRINLCYIFINFDIFDFWLKAGIPKSDFKKFISSFFCLFRSVDMFIIYSIPKLKV